MDDTGSIKRGCTTGLDKGHRDYALLTRLERALIRHARGWDNFVVDIPNLLRQAIDEVIDAPRSRRFLLSELEKTEKTYIGTKVEILLRNHLKLDRGEVLDVRIDGIEVDIVYRTEKNWIISRKALGHCCILIETNEENTHCSFGLIAFHGKPSVISDTAKGEFVLADGTDGIRWMLKEKRYPKRLQDLISPKILEAINASKAGTERLTTVFRLIERTPVSRDIVVALAPQMDTMRSLRKGGRARDRLASEGIFLLSGRYHAALIERLGLPHCTASDFISIKPTGVEDKSLIENVVHP